jgi:hypothetical protein
MDIFCKNIKTLFSVLFSQFFIFNLSLKIESQRLGLQKILKCQIE